MSSTPRHFGRYEAASGQSINRQKTSLFFSRNTKPEVKDVVKNMLGARIMNDCEKYLGLPMVGGQSKVVTFKELQERITKRVMGWKEKFISKAGREVLIKTIAQAIPTYLMSIFKIPKAVRDSINSTLAKYYWDQTKDERKIHWINWKKLCTQNEKGGMGFRDIHAFNLAMLAKQAWRLLHHTHSLFYHVYKARHLPNCSFLEAELGHKPSFVWRSLIAAREVVVRGSRWRVGNGSRILVSSSNWLPHRPIFSGDVDHTLRVADLINRDTWQWDRRKIEDIFAPRTRLDILEIPLCRNRSRDSLVWKENNKHEFTVKTAYKVAMRLRQQMDIEHSRAQVDRKWWKMIWAMNVPPKVKSFMWRACSNILPTRENLRRRKVQVDERCELCCQQLETCAHLLWECPFARNVWAMVRGRVQKCSNEVQDFFHLFQMLGRKLTKEETEKWATLSWAIWNARNKLYFEKIQTHPKVIMEGALAILENYQMLSATQEVV